MQTLFQHRAAGGELLAQHLKSYHGRDHVLVLATSKGGIAVALPLAQQLNLPLDVLLIHKLRHPTQPHIILGALATGGHQLLNHSEIQQQGLPDAELEKILEEGRGNLQRNEAALRGHQVDYNVKGHTVILVDDGIRSGTTMALALQVLRQQQAATVIIACPMANTHALHRLEGVDAQHILHTLTHSFTLQQVYAEPEVDLNRAIDLLAQAQTLRFHDFNLPKYS